MTGPTTMLPPAAGVVPHRGEALLIDRLLSVEEQRLEAELTVRRDTVYSLPDGGLPSWAAPEIMAQAVAAYAGCRSLQQHGCPASMGLLLGVRQLRLAVGSFPAGQVVRVEIVCMSADETGHGVFDCMLRNPDGVAASATLTVYQPQEPAALHALLHGA